MIRITPSISDEISRRKKSHEPIWEINFRRYCQILNQKQVKIPFYKVAYTFPTYYTTSTGNLV